MDSPREGKFNIKPPIFDSSKYIACATTMFPGGNNILSDSESTNNIFCEVETNRTSDGDDNYDTEAMALVMKSFKRSFKKKPDLGLATKLKPCEKEKIDALHELDVLKRKHMNVENDMDSLIKTNKLLESKVANLQVELDKANATFKKLNAGSQVLDQILLSQKVASDRSGLGYEVEVFSKSKEEGKIVKPTEKQIASPKDIAKTTIKKIGNTNVFKQPTPTDARIQRGISGKSTTKRGEVSSFKFKPTCHNCGVIGHIRPHCKKLHASCISNAPEKMNLRKHAQFVPTCHFCGMKGHIRPNCFKLYGYPIAPLNYRRINNNEGRENYFDYDCDRTQKPRCRVISHEKNTNVMPKHAPKVVENFKKVKVRSIWVRKMDLRTCVDFPSNPLDATGSFGGVGLIF
ncbi:hypothetical protein RHGRI_033439 [Rhododendron griersonianum]|uniref:CCHC-type domain-containing protein n=3 Tax=Rhododendron griersonianum TaxID=479676 RepID=A0AAV6HZW0_9ERIC|nr:hypothetical protein RHGRI_033439 [Rhododendron griersonianum]